MLVLSRFFLLRLDVARREKRSVMKREIYQICKIANSKEELLFTSVTRANFESALKALNDNDFSTIIFFVIIS